MYLQLRRSAKAEFVAVGVLEVGEQSAGLFLDRRGGDAANLQFANGLVDVFHAEAETGVALPANGALVGLGTSSKSTPSISKRAT